MPMAGSKEPQNGGWRKVTKSYQPKSTSRRGAAAVTTNDLGLTTANVEATQILFKTATGRGIDPTKEFLVDYLVDEERELIAVYATQTATPGTSAIRRYKNGASSWVSFHLGAAFAEAPSLRPTVKKSHCMVGEELDADGLPIMTIAIKAGLSKNTQSRDTAEPSAETKKAAASDNPDPSDV